MSTINLYCKRTRRVLQHSVLFCNGVGNLQQQAQDITYNLQYFLCSFLAQAEDAASYYHLSCISSCIQAVLVSIALQPFDIQEYSYYLLVFKLCLIAILFRLMLLVWQFRAEPQREHSGIQLYLFDLWGFLPSVTAATMQANCTCQCVKIYAEVPDMTKITF